METLCFRHHMNMLAPKLPAIIHSPASGSRTRMDIDLEYMRLAIDEALSAKQAGEFPIGAVIIGPGGVVARNRCRETAEKTVLAHAETLVVHDACKALGRNDLRDCTIYATNEPCLMCAAAIFQARISRVVYGADRTDFPQYFRSRNLRMRHLAEDSGYAPVLVRGVLDDEIRQMFVGVPGRSR